MAKLFKKKTSRVTVWIPEALEVDLMRKAAEEDRKLSDYVTHLLMNHAYGHFRQPCEPCNVAMRGEED